MVKKLTRDISGGGDLVLCISFFVYQFRVFSDETQKQ